MSVEHEESAYYLRLMSMYIDLATETVLDVFVHHSPGKNPEQLLQSKEDFLIKLKKDRILNKQECDLLLKDDTDKLSLNIPLNIKIFDISLLITLCRNVISAQDLPPPTDGWKHPPRNNDKSIAADLLRLRAIRNVIVGHHPRARLPKWIFDNKWKEISEILVRILHGMDEAKENRIKEKIDVYRSRPLDPTVKSEYDAKLKAWHDEVSKIQAEVEDLLEQLKGFNFYFTNKCDRYERYIALLVKGGHFVLSAFLDKEVVNDGRDLANILDYNKDTLRKVLTSQQLDTLYPSERGSILINPTEWNVGQLAIVILSIFGNKIAPLLRKSVKSIGDASHDYAEKALNALDGNKFEKISTELKARILILSESIDEETTNKCEHILDECDASDAFKTNMAMLKEQGAAVKSFTDLHKETLQRTKECLQEMITNGISFGQCHELDLKMITLGTDVEKKKLAEKILREIWNKALDKSKEKGDYVEVEKEVFKILEEITKGQNQESLSVKMACIILQISCTSPSEMLRLIQYFESCRFQESLGNIAEELGYLFDTSFAVCEVIPIETLWGILNLQSSPTHVQETGFRLSISVSSPADMLQLRSRIDSEKIVKSTQSISKALSNQLSGKITVKAEADMKGLGNVFDEDMINLEESKTDDLSDMESSDLRETSHKHATPNEDQTLDRKDIKDVTRNIVLEMQNKDMNLKSVMKSFKGRIQGQSMSGIYEDFIEMHDQWRNVPLNIAVLGSSGVGKSSFINTLVGGHAGVRDRTYRPKPYQHPDKNIIIWDLPNIGLPFSPNEMYLETIQFQKFDCFIIISDSLFKEDDLFVAKAVKKSEIDERMPIYLVRTKVDKDLSNNKKMYHKQVSENDVLKNIRQDIQSDLWEKHFQEMPLYLIDNYEKDRYDFGLLTKEIFLDLPAEKRKTMALTFLLSIEKAIAMKETDFNKRMWRVCAASGIGGALPVPGVSVMINCGLLVREALEYKEEFGLDRGSMKRLVKLLHIPLEDLQKRVKLQSITNILTVRHILSIISQVAFSEIVLLSAKFPLPVVGGIISGGVSFFHSQFILQELLRAYVNDAKKIHKCIYDFMIDVNSELFTTAVCQE